MGDISRKDVLGGQVSDKLGNKGIDPASLGVLQGGGKEGLEFGSGGDMLPDRGGLGSTPDFGALGESGGGDRASGGPSSGYGGERDPGEHPAGDGAGRLTQGALEDAIKGAGRNTIPSSETVGPTGSFEDPRGTPSAGGLGADPRIGSGVVDLWDAPALDTDDPNNMNRKTVEKAIKEQERGQSGGMTREQIEKEAHEQLVEGTGSEGKTAEQIKKEAEKQSKEGTGGNSGGSSGDSTDERPKTASPPPPASTPDPEGEGPETMAGKKFKEQNKAFGNLKHPIVVSPQDTLIDPGPDGGGSAYREKGRPNLEKAIEQGLDPYVYTDDTGEGSVGWTIKKSPPDTLIDPPKPDSGVDGGPTGSVPGSGETP